ncbi:DUF4365 domain-containing protein [Pseudomonas aeruginosa]|uniref:DUF4365 domain-containing protein n=1 Tax=Pseudomonas aeruginosa TaxID=287 RepID=UPI000AA69003|nr:DUF4365 domain-containing protein [Pseudomonas aeruginosa]EIU2641755.1 DUF4365 domain-containing protein [Pseudomonas aeruginosa]EIU2643326.1 DUF4365 domain-containing protein [Pseudomonas aeruginosa]EIU2718022.1 DUF4365 domain-containing protein [Pseudomonas aeruginosa]EIU2719753.1 DUF4365 domain-containing protein [Pseudomonas aeruginosa]EIU2863215.1 DUF4365 domain-containing protein [Pseudomonas aeruginosa]
MKRDLGKAGESKFVSWCSDVGITINKAEEDKHGWDFILEIPVNRATGSAFDLHKSNMICKVQVKATEGRKLSKSVELSNLHALATDPLPVFYLFLHFDKDATPVAAYLLHLDESIIKRTLKLAREHIFAGEGDRLHKKSLTLRYDESHRLSEPSGLGLLKYIEDNHYSRWRGYLGEKQETLHSAGFEDGGGDICFTIKGAEQRENFILGSLGYANKIAVSDFSFWYKRFGIKDPKPAVAMANAVMTMTRADFIQTRVMITSPTIETLVLPAKVYLSPFINSLDRAIFRVSTEFVDIHANAGTGKIKVTPAFVDDKAYSLNLLRKALIFFEKIIASRHDVSVFFEHQGNFLRIFNAYTNPLDKSIERLSDVASYLSDIFKDSFDCSSLSVSLNWLRENGRAVQDLLGLKKGLGRFKITFEQEENSDCICPSRAHFFHYRTLVLDSICYVFIFAAQCVRFHDDEGRHGFFGDFKLVKEMEGPNSESWISEILASEVSRLGDELIKVGDVYCDDYWSDLSNAPTNLMIRIK